MRQLETSILSEHKRSLIRDPFDAHNLPEPEMEVKQPPSIDSLGDFEHILENHGVNFEDMQQIAIAYDLLRETRRSSAQMIEHNSDRQLSMQFNKKLKGLVETLKAEKNQKSPAVHNINANLILLDHVNDKLQEYFNFTDPDVYQVYNQIMRVNQQIVQNCMDLYFEAINGNPLFSEL